MLPTNTWTAEQELSQKRVLIYALGGGNGHIQRADLIAQQCADATIMHQKEAPFSSSVPVIHPKEDSLLSWSVETLKEGSSMYDCIVVDTFPKGIGHEITKEILQCYASSFLVARYLRTEMYQEYALSSSWYTNIWLPYSIEQCEWSIPPSEIYMGPTIRPIKINKEQTALCVIGERNSIPKRWSSLFPKRTIFIHHRFHTLPRAKKYLCVGAGYNLFWELNALGVEAAHIPIEKRYDDQFRRVMRFGTMISTYDQLFNFLRHCS